jgi:DNA modification methylase
MDNAAYNEFLKAKMNLTQDSGVECEAGEINPLLKPHQRDMVVWGVKGGRRAYFAAFGLGKTWIQLETERLILEKTGGGKGLIVTPLGARREFRIAGEQLAIPTTFIRSTADAERDGIYLTNYESVREGKIDPSLFKVVSLDEAAVLRSFGSKTFGEMLFGPMMKVPYRFVATACPNPNEFLELIAYAHFLGVMDMGEAKTRFFKRNSEHADHLTLHPHKEKEFWLWVASWAVFIQKPSDLGYSDEGYELPPLDIRWHEISTDHNRAGNEKNGQRRLLHNTALGVSGASREKRESLAGRLKKLMEIRAEEPEAHRIIWHDLEAERRALEERIPGLFTIYGTQKLEDREEKVGAFADGEIREIAAKPVMLGSGVNLQRHCSRAVYLGIGFKFNDFIQSIHRLYRFLQPDRVRIDLIYTEAEREVRSQLERKWGQYNEMVKQMTGIIREYGLSRSAMAHRLTRSIGVTRAEASGNGWRLINNDCVEELATIGKNSIGLILTSIPFSSQYEYTPSYNDFGHTDDAGHFWRQMEFLIPSLLRSLKPGRVCAVHVKDRVVPGALTGLGFQTIQPFHADAVHEFMRHGFAYLGMKSIITDVVRENAQTYRLGWTEQCKDGSRMGCGLPEYVLLFRKPPTDAGQGWADERVVKSKEEYTRARWQFDAHGFMRSSGDRLLMPEDFIGMSFDKIKDFFVKFFKGMSGGNIYRWFKNHSLHHVYDFDADVAIAEAVDKHGMLPPTFQLLPPQSWHEDVWTDVTRMRTMNSLQSVKGREKHLCPLQFDICDRIINQYSNIGDVVLDPFSGLGTVVLRAVKLGRQGVGIELNANYHKDGVYWLRRGEGEVKSPSLFDMAGVR